MTGDVRTWVEIDARALRHNAEQFFKLIPATTRLMAVVKSNAYGHDLALTARVLSKFQVSGRRFQELWFGVDSLVEGLRLRREGVKNPVLVLGYTLPERIREAVQKDIALTVSSFDALQAIAANRVRPAVHIKIDTGMNRQGFLPVHTAHLVSALKRSRIIPQGLYTHFASAKDPKYPAYTRQQFLQFQKVMADFAAAGFTSLIRHAASSGGALIFPETHLDMVRIGMGLYGYWPSPETRNLKLETKMNLRPVLAWKTIVSEVKEIPKGSLVGYDGTERVKRKTKIAVLPIGYWHGYDRGLSGKGNVLIRGRRAGVLGRISMDMTVVDVSDIPRCCGGDEAVLIGRQGKDGISAEEIGANLNTTHYEVLTRINPLIRRVIV